MTLCLSRGYLKKQIPLTLTLSPWERGLEKQAFRNEERKRIIERIYIGIASNYCGFARMVFAILAIAGGMTVLGEARADSSGNAMAQAANQFLAALKAEQKAAARFEWKDEERINWHYVPIERKGLPLKEMTTVQKQLAFALLSSGLSGRGFTQAVTIMTLEQILWELENQSPKRDPEKYFVSIFGTPGPGKTWGWRVEGHHLSVNFTLVDGKVASGTPCFYATNPAHVKQGPRKGLRVLAREEDLGRKLVQSLDEAQAKQAIFDAAPPRDILTREEPRVKPLEKVGLPVAKMTGDQKATLYALVREYLFRHRPVLARVELESIRKLSEEKIFFAWAGGTERGQGHYYRIQGPVFLLEYANTQNDANHVHACWRDFKGDFGADMLAGHYAAHHGGE